MKKSYDDFALKWSENLKNWRNYLQKYLEKPAMYKKLKNIHWKNILCIGSWSWEECEYIKSLWAKKVTWIDLSKLMILVARENYKEIDFQIMNMEDLKFSDNTFDIVFSSLAIDYSKNLQKTFKEVKRVLKPKWTFIFSSYHPIKWWAEITRNSEKNSFITWYEKLNNWEYKVFWDYLNKRRVKDKLFDELEIAYYNRPISEITNNILKSWFIIKDFQEPKPIKEFKTINPKFYNIHSKIPIFMIFELKKLTN